MRILCRIAQVFVLLAVASSFAQADGEFVYFKKKAAAGGGGTETIGYETAGSSNTQTTEGVLVCSAMDAPANSGNITSIFIYSSNTNAALKIKVGVYADDAGSIGNKVGSEVEFTPGTYSAEWHEYSGLSIPVTASTNYWLCRVVDSSTAMTFYYNSDAANSRWQIDQAYASAWPSSMTGEAGSTAKFSLKATVTY